MRPFRWVLAAALVLAAVYVLVTMAARAQARERWAAVLDHWHGRRSAFMAECFPEAPESESEQVRRGFTAEIVVHADLAGPTEERDLERLVELFGEIGVRVEPE